MLGHKLWLTSSSRHETWATLRGGGDSLPEVFDRARVVPNVSADRFETVKAGFHRVRPGARVSCIGVVKQRPEANDPIVAITVNSLFPHQVAALCAERGAGMVQISTARVFSGRAGL